MVLNLPQGYWAVTTKNLENFSRNPEVPREVRDNIRRFCNKANGKVNGTKNFEIEEVPEGAL